MAKRKPGKQPEERPGPGRPPRLTGGWSRSTVILEHRQISALDHLAADIRANTGKAINRAELIRAMIDAVLDSKVDLSYANSQEHVRAILFHRLHTGQSPVPQERRIYSNKPQEPRQ